MSNQIVAFITFGIILFHGCEMIYGTFVVPPLCKPGVIEDMPHHIKKVCLALENSDQLTSALESFINREASSFVSADLLNKLDKRSDVDHVFLRFGKRR
ncbi:dromyosuppressin isoform X2 [Glossina fuscipes]|nr:dromyosuppressin isoform X2 [Glossina fuscipes]